MRMHSMGMPSMFANPMATGSNPLYAVPGGYVSPYFNAYGTYSSLPYLSAYLNAYGAAYGGGIDGTYVSYESSPRPYRRRRYDGDKAARDKAASAKEERLQREQERLLHSRDHPSVPEIWSGTTLNILLADLRKLAAHSNDLDASSPLDEATLQHINVNHGPGNMALLKRHGYWQWPDGLMGAEYQIERDRLRTASLAAVAQMKAESRIEPSLLQQMADDVDRIGQRLRTNASILSPPVYIEAKTFLHYIEDALVALRQPDAANHFNGNYLLQAGTTAELVRQMAAQGLQFAPALPEDRAAYAVMHDFLARWDRAAQQQAAR
jgi:hypothetical protein